MELTTGPPLPDKTKGNKPYQNPTKTSIEMIADHFNASFHFYEGH